MAKLEWYDFFLEKTNKLKTNLKIISKNSIVSPTLKLFKLNINRDHKISSIFQILVQRIQNALTMVLELSIVRKQIYKKKHFFDFF